MRDEPPLTTAAVTAAAITLIALIALIAGLLLLEEELWMAISLALGVTIIGATVGWFWARRT